MFFQEKYVNRDKELEAEKEEILAEEDAIIAGGSTGNEKYGGEEEEEMEEVDEELEVGLPDKQLECTQMRLSLFVSS